MGRTQATSRRPARRGTGLPLRGLAVLLLGAGALAGGGYLLYQAAEAAESADAETTNDISADGAGVAVEAVPAATGSAADPVSEAPAGATTPAPTSGRASTADEAGEDSATFFGITVEE